MPIFLVVCIAWHGGISATASSSLPSWRTKSVLNGCEGFGCLAVPTANHKEKNKSSNCTPSRDVRSNRPKSKLHGHMRTEVVGFM